MYAANARHFPYNNYQPLNWRIIFLTKSMGIVLYEFYNVHHAQDLVNDTQITKVSTNDVVRLLQGEI